MTEEERKKRARENSRRYYQAHREEVIARTSTYSKKRYNEDEEYRKRRYKTSRKWLNKNPQKGKEYQAKYRNTHKTPRYVQLQTRIDKAIEYIRINKCNNNDINDCWHEDFRDILNILKGEE